MNANGSKIANALRDNKADKTKTGTPTPTETPTADRTEVTQPTENVNREQEEKKKTSEQKGEEVKRNAEQTTVVKTAMDKLKERSKIAGANALISGTERMSMFDSTKASANETTGTSSMKSITPAEGGFVVSGRNIGAEEREPKWTPEQMKFIRNMCRTELQIEPVKDTRRSVMDVDQEYVGRDDNGSIVPQEAAYISSLDPTKYCVGTGPGKFDSTGSPRFYKDLVVADFEGRWLLNQLFKGTDQDVHPKLTASASSYIHQAGNVYQHLAEF